MTSLLLVSAMTPWEVWPSPQSMVAVKPVGPVVVPSEKDATTPVNDWLTTGLTSMPVAFGATIV